MEIAMLSRLPQESTRDYVYRFLKENIMRLKLSPGSALSEKDISALLDVSRTPVREAFIQLSQEYLLDILPQKGTYVSLIDLENVEESRFLRETVELAVIEHACREFPKEQLFELQSYLTLQDLCIKEKNNLKFFEIDEALHGAIFIGCQKARIWAMIEQMNTHYNRVRMLNIAGGYDLPAILEQHRELVRAIRDKDLAVGRKVIKLHLNKVNFDIKDLLRDYSNYFKKPALHQHQKYTGK